MTGWLTVIGPTESRRPRDGETEDRYRCSRCGRPTPARFIVGPSDRVCGPCLDLYARSVAVLAVEA
jgi:hypothetical protein